MQKAERDLLLSPQLCNRADVILASAVFSAQLEADKQIFFFFFFFLSSAQFAVTGYAAA